MSEESELFHIRTARKDLSDGVYIAEAFDGSQAFLASIGSGSQWGSKKKREDPAFMAAAEQLLDESLEEPDKTGFFIAEKGDVRCGGAITVSVLPGYVKSSLEALNALGSLPSYDYLNFLIADQSVQPLSKGVGTALIRHVVAEARRKARKAILVDCWDGNNGLLEGWVAVAVSRELRSDPD